ncbi:MAG: tetratricopeptide repeat protein [Terriglobia bacterium]
MTAIAVAASATDQIQDLMQRAAEAGRSGNTDLSAALYKKVLRLRPHWGPAEYDFGLTTLLQKDYSDAATLFAEALRDDPSLVDAYLFQGTAYYNLGDYGRALPPLKKFLHLQPNDTQVRFFLAGTYYALDDYSDAALQYLGQVKFSARQNNLYYYLGHCYLALAREAVKTLSRGPKGKYYVNLILGEQEAQENNTPLAMRYFQDAIKISPDSPEGYVDLGNLYLQNGNVSMAATQFREVLRKNLQGCSALEGLGDADLAVGKVTSALANYEAAVRARPACIEEPPPENLGLHRNEFSSRLRELEAYPASPKWGRDVTLQLARLEYGTAEGVPGVPASAEAMSGPDTPSAARISASCAERMRAGGFHSYAEAHLFMASCAELHGDLGGATSAVVAAGQEAPSDAKAAYWALRIYMRLSRRVFVTLVALSPGSYLVTEMRAEQLELRGKDAEADSQYREAAESSGRDPNPLIGYARFECKKNRLDQAAPILKKALDLAPFNASANSLMGYIYFTKNQFETAVPFLDKAIKANPDDEQSRIYLAESLGKLHRIHVAMAILEGAPSDNDGRVHYVLARYYREAGHKKKMEQALAFFGARQKQLQKKQNSIY